MYFYVDETGHTGPNLFDLDQPKLYYGVISCKVDIDIVAEPYLNAMRQKLGVERLHATELGSGGLVQILPELLELQRNLDVRFNVHRVMKCDYAAITFFMDVFNPDRNPAMSRSSYTTALCYPLILQLGCELFTPEISKLAWNARINTDTATATPQLAAVCQLLLDRLGRITESRSREIIGDVLRWAKNNANLIAYNARTEADRLEIMPNMLGFQLVLHGIAARIAETGIKASKIIVDEQLQFNKSQRSLADYYRSDTARHARYLYILEAGKMDLDHMPEVPLSISSSANSCGLELVDITLWVVKRVKEGRKLAPELKALMEWRPIMADEISLHGIATRWAPYFEKQADHFVRPAQYELLRAMHVADEARRIRVVNEDRRRHG